MLHHIEHREDFEKIGWELLKSKPDLATLAEQIESLDIRIAYLLSDEEKKKPGKIIFGECKKISPFYRAWCCYYDFAIIVYAPNIAKYEFTEEQLELLIWHELKHVGVDLNGSKPKLYTVPHDIEEFEAIAREAGIGWARPEGDREAETVTMYTKGMC